MKILKRINVGEQSLCWGGPYASGLSAWPIPYSEIFNTCWSAWTDQNRFWFWSECWSKGLERSDEGVYL
jgi:hypothetical protein